MNNQDTKSINDVYASLNSNESSKVLTESRGDHRTVECAAYYAIGYYAGGQGYMEDLDRAIAQACDYLGLDTRIDGPAVESIISEIDPDLYGAGAI